jgi:uncharacterized membrane protein
MLETILFFAVLLVLLPALGFFITLAFFPKKELDLLERIVFSAVLGLIFPALFLLLENQVFGLPINFASAITTIIALLIVSFLIFYLRKRK